MTHLVGSRNGSAVTATALGAAAVVGFSITEASTAWSGQNATRVNVSVLEYNWRCTCYKIHNYGTPRSYSVVSATHRS
jgi:hypothetical protein